MLDQLSRNITNSLGALLHEADKLRRSLTALGSRNDPSAADPRTRSSGSRPSSERRATASSSSAAAPRQTPRSRAKQPTRASSSQETAPRRESGNGGRNASGATKSAVLATLANGKAMTAGEIATATGLGRASVSTTLSRLAKSGELTKVPRGYQIAQPAGRASPTT